MTINQKQFQFSKDLGLLLVYAGNMGIDFSIREVKRSKERQEELYQIGRRGVEGEKVVTWTMASKHINSLAADIIVFEDGQPVWDSNHWAYQEMAKLWRGMGNKWGGDWAGKNKDGVHFEYVG